MKIRKGDGDKKDFIYHEGVFRYKSMYSGLSNDPAKFQRALDHIIIKWKTCIVYLDDVIVF